MNSRGNNSQFRSVPLIQRGDWSMLTGTDQAPALRDSRFSHAAAYDSTATYVPIIERRRSVDERPDGQESRRRRRRREEGRDTLREERATRTERRSRQERRPKESPREHVSAYFGESTVVSVSARSERRPSFGTSQSTPDRFAFATPAFDEPRFREPMAWGDVSYDRAEDRESPRLPRRNCDGQTVHRDWLYTGEDDEPRGVPGASRRREAVIGALAAIPQGIAAGALGLFAHMRGLLVVLLAALTALMLYAPARELYIANRRLDQLQATYDVLLEENDALRGDLELLQTREGIENEARSRGYVEAGETKVIVEGLPETQLKSDPTSFMGPLEIPDNTAWYTRLLDTLFGYEME